MPTKGLTNKEQRFAKAVAAGATQGAAYRSVYSAEGSAATQRANGHRIAKKAHVSEEIRRLRYLPAVDDYAEIKKQMIERLLDIAENGNATAQHRAILALIRYADDGVERQPAKDPVPDVEQLLRELRANIEVESPEDQIAQVNPIGIHCLEKTPPVQAQSLRVEDNYGMVPDKARQGRLVNTAEARTEAYPITREAEIRAQHEYVCRSREEVRRLTEEKVLEETAPTAYPPACGPQPGYRREMIRGRFPPQYRWVPIVEEEDD
jgi:hypothetical protein